MTKILIDTGPSERGWHRAETVLHCPQMFAYKYKLGLQDNDSGPLVRGTLGHVGLAHYYARLMCVARGLDPNVYYYDPLDAVQLKADRVGAAAQPFIEPIQGLVRHYIADRVMEAGALEILGVEVPVETRINGHRITQKLDLVVRDQRRKVYFYDHKFVARIDKKSIDRYGLSGQFLLMETFGRELFGQEFGGARINLLGVNDFKIERAEPPPRPFAKQEFARTIDFAEKLIAFYDNTDPWHWPKMFSETVCYTPYGRCPFFDLCREGPPEVA